MDGNLTSQAVLTNFHDDPVSHPSHYTYGRIECIDYICDKGFDFCLGNVIKYVTRAGHKNDAIEDLRKAAWYLNKAIEERSTIHVQA